MVIPDDLTQREGDILLRFILNDLRRLGTVDRRQLDELIENLIARSADIGLFARDGTLGHNFAKRFFKQSLACGILRTQ